MRRTLAHSHTSSVIAERARALRSFPTLSELKLWQELKGKRQGVAFRRQYPVGRYVADFAAPSVRLIVEVDGGYHARRARADARRDRARRACRLARAAARGRAGRAAVAGGAGAGTRSARARGVKRECHRAGARNLRR
jgi:Protein of unknown function (DUF559)